MKKKRSRPVFAKRSWSLLDLPRYRERFLFALAVSIYIHGLILLLTYGVAGLGVPWAEQQQPGVPLQVRMVEAPREAAPPPEPVALKMTPTIAIPEGLKPPPDTPRDPSTLEVRIVEAPVLPEVVIAAPAPAPPPKARERKARPKPQPRILAQTRPDEETFKVRPQRREEPEEERAPKSTAKALPDFDPRAVKDTERVSRRPVPDPVQIEKEREAVKLAEARARADELSRKAAEEEQKRDAARLAAEEEKKRQDAARLAEEEKKKQEAVRLAEEDRKKQEAARLAEEQKKKEEAARLAAEEEKKKQEAARLAEEEKKKQADALKLALEVEALKRAEETARQQAEAKRKAAEDAAARAKELAARQQEGVARAPGAPGSPLPGEKGPATAGPLSGRELAAKAIETLRSPGEREAIIRSPAPTAKPDDPRRRSLFGFERDVGLRMYAEAFRSKIERNGALNYSPMSSYRARDAAIVTVSIRSDGSLEDIRIHRSSGVRELDEAVHRIVNLNAPYSKFPPALARQYDVIEIRRIWFFDDTLKILDEM